MSPYPPGIAVFFLLTVPEGSDVQRQFKSYCIHTNVMVKNLRHFCLKIKLAVPVLCLFLNATTHHILLDSNVINYESYFFPIFLLEYNRIYWGPTYVFQNEFITILSPIIPRVTVNVKSFSFSCFSSPFLYDFLKTKNSFHFYFCSLIITNKNINQ